MSDPITPREWDDLPTTTRTTAADALQGALTALARELYGTPDDVLTLDGPAAPLQRDYHLARIAAATTITEYLRRQITEDAYAAGAVEGSPATYTALGHAAGLTKEGSRSRFPGAVPDAKPGRPRKQQVTVSLEGGHPQWDGVELEFDRDAVYDCPLDDVGGYLLIPDGSFPDHLEAGVDWRAHYAPTSEDTRAVWVFQGWAPS